MTNLTLSLDNNYLFKLNNITTWLPRLNNAPDLSPLSEPTKGIYQAALTEWLANGNIIPVPIAPPTVPQPDWVELNNVCLGGALNGMYNRLTEACFVNPATATLAQLGNANNIAVAKGLLDQSVAVTKVEGAVAASVNLLLTTSSYVFTGDEKALWNSTLASLNFSSLVFLI